MSYEYITNRDAKAFTPAAQSQRTFGMPRVIEGITVHWWGDPNQNPSFEGIVNYLCRDGANTSAHFVATGTGRKVACIVAPVDVAWHSGSAWGNARTIGIELDPRARPEDYDVAAELIADIRSAYGDVPLYRHDYFSSTQCPGVWDHYRLDELSYTKYSAPIEWGQGGDKNPKEPIATPPPVVVVPTPPSVEPAKPTSLWRLFVNDKQVAAYSKEQNAHIGYVNYGRSGRIELDGKNVTVEILAKYEAPSPTTGQPDSGKPVVDKDDYEETKRRVGVIEAFIETLKKLFASLGGK